MQNSQYIKDFRFGLDRRKSELTQRPGTLQVLENGFINQGGEVQNRKAFVRTARIANSFGLQPTSSGLYNFGSADLSASHPVNIGTVGTPIYVYYQRLKHPKDLFDGTSNTVAMTAVAFSDQYRGKAVVFATYADGNTYGYYDGTLMYDFVDGNVASWLDTNDKIAQAIEAMIDRTTEYSATRSTNTVQITGPLGQGYDTATNENSTSGTLTALKDSDPTNPIVARQAIGSFEVVAGSASAGTNEITNIEVGAAAGPFVAIISSTDIDWTTSNEITASAIATAINAHTSSPEYTAEANGAVVTIKAAASVGDTPNDFVVRVSAAGNFCVGKAHFQVINAVGAGFSCTGVYISGINILTGTITWASTTAQLATDIVANINTNTTGGTAHGYLACAIGSNIFVSKAVTRSDDAYLPIYFTTNLAAGTSGSGIFEVGSTTGTNALQVVLKVVSTTQGKFQLGAGLFAPRTTWIISATIAGGVPPYLALQWFNAGTYSVVDSTHISVYKNGPINTFQYPVLPPAVYAIATDSLGQTSPRADL
jgi:hypothetical protein